MKTVKQIVTHTDLYRLRKDSFQMEESCRRMILV